MKDLLGHEIDEADEVTAYLREIDEDTIDARARNLAFICEVAPDAGFMMPSETFHVFTEARDSFVNGLYVATLLLSQAFIEHRLQSFMHEIGESQIADKGLNAIVKRLLEIRPTHKFILSKIDKLRAFRNPFTHLKSFDHPHTITQVSLAQKTHPNEVLYQRAKDSIAIMYTVATMDLR
ncbi:hypothetical protein [Ectopseudomonas mendocina]|uniref:hypothetical protein n=1 Tax=Ectopseudomonas mendocina TaxID=300 RepID=UPI00376F38CD